MEKNYQYYCFNFFFLVGDTTIYDTTTIISNNQSTVKQTFKSSLLLETSEHNSRFN